jgi:hypothetical protein
MAEPVALGIKPPQVMSLGDMLNLARGAQSYQQAEQLNPLAVQKAQMDVEQTRSLNPVTLGKAREELSQAKIGTAQKQLEIDQSHFNLAGNIMGGLETRAQSLAKKGDTATALNEFKAARSWMDASGIPYDKNGAVKQAEEQLKNKDFNGYLATLENMRNVLGGAASRYQSNLPQTATLAGAPATYTPATGVAKPLEIQGEQPPVAPPPSVAPPPQFGKSQGGAQPQTGVTPTQMSLPYPVRKAGDIRPLAPSEEADRDNGQKYRESLAQSTTNLSKSIRNIDEVIKDAEKIASQEWNRGAGIAGTVGRTVSTFLGTEMGVEYARLSKSLAQLQLALGADTTTDRGKDLMAAANGTITLPPDILQEIAHRTRAEKQNIEMQSQGAQIFSQKYGDANLKKFQKDWADNSKDSRVLEAISINNSDMSAEEKQAQINRLFENASPKYLEDVKRYRRNLEKLSKTGGL